jgi:hypothetical protein
MTKYRTAMGKTIDMASLTAKNEKVRAVGNMSVNARGDTIDAQGKVVVPATKKVSNNYQKTVGNKSANVVKPQSKANKSAPPQLTQEEIELEQSFDDDLEIEQIKAQEIKGKNK